MGAKRSKRTERRERGSGGKLPFRTTLTFPSFFCRTQIRPPPLSHSPLTKRGERIGWTKKGEEGGQPFLPIWEMERWKSSKGERKKGGSAVNHLQGEKKTGFGISILHYPGGKKERSDYVYLFLSTVLRRGGEEKEVDP